MMKTEQIKSKRTRTARLFVTTVAAVILAAVCVLFCRITPPVAETSGVVTVHVYDAQMQYSSLGGWFWIKGESGMESKLSSSAASDEPYYKSYTENGQTVTNRAHTFTVNLSADQITQLKNGKTFGMLVCAATGNGTATDDFWTRYTKETADIMLDLSVAFDTNNCVDVYYIRKDTAAYTDIEEAKMALEKVTGARFTQKTSSSVTVEFEATSPITDSTKVSVYNGEEIVATANARKSGTSSFAGVATFTQLNNTNFDFTVDYVLKVDGIPTGASIAKTILIDDVEFIKTFENVDTQNLDYGAFYSKEETSFRVWAPFASSVALKLYENGSAGEAYAAIFMQKRIPEGKSWGGVWELTLAGDYKGRYYTYVINNYGMQTETIDPYAKACGANGLRGMIVDLASTDPAGWSNDKHLYAKNAAAADTPIVWEVSVKDFSSSVDSGMKYKGKYLAFTEQNTTVPGDPSLKTGINYLKDLGVTYVHLNPVYDFATVDETELLKADNTKDNFNWGYDPQNYNIPEGSYSTDPANGNVRIKEFKQMVMALHNAGIGVIMDVVYNHTYATSGQALHDTVPYYYHHTDETGAFTNDSGCGNATASERAMMRKYMVDSMLYWAEEYHIDGFRFDLMGIHDVVTLNTVRAELDKLDGGNGKKLLIYGEPWSADGTYVPASYTARVNATKTAISGAGKFTNNANNRLMKEVFQDSFGSDSAMNVLDPRIAVFNGSGRDGLRGECSDRRPTSGWVNGAPNNLGRVRRMLEGGVGGYAEGLQTGTGSRNVAYAAAHDNYTLWDQIRGAKYGEQPALYYDNADENDVKRCKLVASAYMMSTGISFMLAGEEMGRTKYGNENSYNSPAKLNRIAWTRQKEFSDLRAFYKELIALRRQYGSQLFSYEKSTSAAYCYGSFGVTDYESGRFTFSRTQGGATLALDLNPSTLTGTVKIGAKTLRV